MKDRTVEYFPGDDKNEDVEGHVVSQLSSEGEYDVQGHIGVEVERERLLPDAPEGDEDVEAHVQPPRDLDVERF